MSEIIGRGAEAIIIRKGDRVIKHRLSKGYRIPQLDERIRRERTRLEAKLTSMARRCGVPTPIVYDVDEFDLVLEYIEGISLKQCLNEALSMRAGKMAATLHKGGIVHYDLTTSNMLLDRHDRLYLIDFGLAAFDSSIEGFGVDVHLYLQSVRATHADEALTSAFLKGYRSASPLFDEVMDRVKEIERRARYL
ncbi:Kae1-associated kinase Bud32 [Methermicoccus shengliensis]|uniref:non-specific serine/threonine protein kinase n=1 Tax=Methermicoccus shengliensis TaxID=660064 RepID=A0A832RWW2_9EURY|nr:Kae1-associated kinase Bud32 [Methermicoccus shengliensis]KUK04590.1 MAG: Mn2+-dependent serine/threonine protein kinase [Euryarchaeota archaeon 55_53]KUK29978.1 MAG: Mn2+-dependent serine/threonine protein kinase [Methanosarcinales archeaon 56_1174]MDI3488460.1 regulating kinase and related kinase [Methanosarcinales archaeon]MDN5294918.1 regulating kinase and related kinase [Methanosarcinales archaeon]HIH70110.1 Kae1-associated kinase Bud32 [Methermicoccus shengliensis]